MNMNMTGFEQLLAEYGPAALVIAAAAALGTVITERAAGQKMPRFLKSFMPAALSALALVIYDMAVKKCFCPSYHALCTGIAAGSLSTAIAALIRRMLVKGAGGVREISTRRLAAEGFLSGYVPDGDLEAAAAAVCDLLEKSADYTEEQLSEKLSEILDEFAVPMTDTERAAIISALKKLPEDTDK